MCHACHFSLSFQIPNNLKFQSYWNHIPSISYTLTLIPSPLNKAITELSGSYLHFHQLFNSSFAISASSNTNHIFLSLPLLAFWRGNGLRDSLICSSFPSNCSPSHGTFPCRRCEHLFFHLSPNSGTQTIFPCKAMIHLQVLQTIVLHSMFTMWLSLY